MEKVSSKYSCYVISVSDFKKINLEEHQRSTSYGSIEIFQDERTNLINVDLSSLEIKNKKLEIFFSSLTQEVLKDCESLKVLNCPSTNIILQAISSFDEIHLKKLSTPFCFHFIINGEISDLTEIQLCKLANHFKNLKKSFLIIFESLFDNSYFMYWQIKGSYQFFSLLTVVNVGTFVKDFLFKSLQNGHNGK